MASAISIPAVTLPPGELMRRVTGWFLYRSRLALTAFARAVSISSKSSMIFI
jgi:hypothetical protein